MCNFLKNENFVMFNEVIRSLDGDIGPKPVVRIIKIKRYRKFIELD